MQCLPHATIVHVRGCVSLRLPFAFRQTATTGASRCARYRSRLRELYSPRAQRSPLSDRARRMRQARQLGGRTGLRRICERELAASTTDSASHVRSARRLTPVRGTLARVSDSALTVPPLAAMCVLWCSSRFTCSRHSAKLSSVTPSSFVGVTLVAQPDGSQRATEIHIFPEELRGTGEGNYP